MSSPVTIPSNYVSAFCDSYGPAPEVIKINKNSPIPQTLGKNQVLVKVHSASINPVDFKLISGALANFWPVKFPFTPGFDLSGTIVAIGPLDASTITNPESFSIGDSVLGDGAINTSGSFAEYATIEINKIVKKPKELSFNQAAALPLAGLTAIQGLSQHGGIKEGSRVLILGGAGGVGSFAIQIAKLLGASFVATTVSEASKSFIQNIGGVDLIIDRNSEDFSRILSESKVDIVFDCVGGSDHWQRAQKILVNGGRFIAIAGPGNQSTAEALFKYIITESHDNQSLLKLVNWVAEGKLKIFIDKVFNGLSIEQVLNIIQASQTGKTKGKLILQIQE